MLLLCLHSGRRLIEVIPLVSIPDRQMLSCTTVEIGGRVGLMYCKKKKLDDDPRLTQFDTEPEKELHDALCPDRGGVPLVYALVLRNKSNATGALIVSLCVCVCASDCVVATEEDIPRVWSREPTVVDASDLPQRVDALVASQYCINWFTGTG